MNAKITPQIPSTSFYSCDFPQINHAAFLLIYKKGTLIFCWNFYLLTLFILYMGHVRLVKKNGWLRRRSLPLGSKWDTLYMFGLPKHICQVLILSFSLISIFNLFFIFVSSCNHKFLVWQIELFWTFLLYKSSTKI